MFTKANCIHEESLLKVCDIELNSIENIKNAVKFYLWDCLISSKISSVKLDSKFFDDNQKNITNLQILLLTDSLLKKENLLYVFNKLQKIVFKNLRKSALTQKSERVQFPVNVRVQSGSLDNDERPRMHPQKYILTFGLEIQQEQ